MSVYLFRRWWKQILYNKESRNLELPIKLKLVTSDLGQSLCTYNIYNSACIDLVFFKFLLVFLPFADKSTILAYMDLFYGRSLDLPCNTVR